VEIQGEKTIRGVVGYKCDACGNLDKRMESITAQHYEWGNDSVDSIKHFHFCKAECFKEVLNKVFEHTYYKEHKSYISNVPVEYLKDILEIKKERK
jgi:hypothetical protein